MGGTFRSSYFSSMFTFPQTHPSLVPIEYHTEQHWTLSTSYKSRAVATLHPTHVDKINWFSAKGRSTSSSRVLFFNAPLDQARRGAFCIEIAQIDKKATIVSCYILSNNFVQTSRLNLPPLVHDILDGRHLLREKCWRHFHLSTMIEFLHAAFFRAPSIFCPPSDPHFVEFLEELNKTMPL